MKYILKVLAYVFAFIAVLDIVGFAIWATSGQLPQDKMFLGGMTATVLQAVIK